jgi:hypothetical protein
LRDRIPFLFAALLVAALIAVVGVAAFSINTSEDPPQEEAYDGVISGRVASAVLAVSVSTAGSEALQPLPIEPIETAALEPTETVEAATTTQAPVSTSAPTTTNAADTTAPNIVVTSPQEGAAVTSSVVEFAGTSEAGAFVSSGPYEATMADDGSWTIKLVVSSGYNSTVFTAADEAGNESSARIVVYYELPTTTTKPPSTTTTTHVHPPSTTTTTKPKPPPSNCPVSGSCSSQWPADSAGARGGEAWRSVVAQYWPAERVQCVVDLIQRESSGNPQANNSGRYLGLLQHSVWGWNGRAQAIGLVDGTGLTAHPYNGAANIAAGAWLANNSTTWWKPWPPTRDIPSCQALGAK